LIISSIGISGDLSKILTTAETYTLKYTNY